MVSKVICNQQFISYVIKIWSYILQTNHTTWCHQDCVFPYIIIVFQSPSQVSFLSFLVLPVVCDLRPEG